MVIPPQRNGRGSLDRPTHSLDRSRGWRQTQYSGKSQGGSEPKTIHSYTFLGGSTIREGQPLDGTVVQRLGNGVFVQFDDLGIRKQGWLPDPEGLLAVRQEVAVVIDAIRPRKDNVPLIDLILQADFDKRAESGAAGARRALPVASRPAAGPGGAMAGQARLIKESAEYWGGGFTSSDNDSEDNAYYLRLNGGAEVVLPHLLMIQSGSEVLHNGQRIVILRTGVRSEKYQGLELCCEADFLPVAERLLQMIKTNERFAGFGQAAKPILVRPGGITHGQEVRAIRGGLLINSRYRLRAFFIGQWTGQQNFRLRMAGIDERSTAADLIRAMAVRSLLAVPA
jgi:hypothetical protein